MSVYSIVNVFFFSDFLKIIKRRRLFKQIVCSNMLDIENVTNFEIEKSNLNESTNNERIRKMCIKSIQLIDEHARIYLQNKLHVIKIKTNLFQSFKNLATFSLHDVVFFFDVWSDFVFITHRLFFFIAQNHQIFFSIFKIRVHREYDHINRIIDEDKNEKIDKNNFENIHCFLLNRISYEEYILFQKNINRLSNENKIRNENSIEHANFDKFTNVDRVLTKESIQNLDDFRCIWMSFFNVANEIDHSQFFAAELKFFLENNAIRSFNVCQNVIKSLNIFHHVSSSQFVTSDVISVNTSMLESMMNDDWIAS